MALVNATPKASAYTNFHVRRLIRTGLLKKAARGFALAPPLVTDRFSLLRLMELPCNNRLMAKIPEQLKAKFDELASGDARLDKKRTPQVQTENPDGEGQGASFQPENETGSADNQSVGKITEWLDTENLKKATGKSRDEIYELFGNTPEPIAKISEEYIKYLDPDIQDSTVYCGKGYFIDHAVNHHPEVTPSEYQKIPEILAYPDDVKLDTKNKERHSLVFIKKYDNNKIVIVSTYEDNDKKLVFHKSFFYSKNTPYKSLTSVRGDLPLSGATSDISHADASAPAGNRLSGRNGKETPPTQGKSFDNQINHSGVNILSSTGADKSSEPLFQLDRDGEMNELHKIQEAYLLISGAPWGGGLSSCPRE